jgi:hypothetical protein
MLLLLCSRRPITVRHHRTRLTRTTIMPHGPRLSFLPDFEGRTSLYRKLDTYGKGEIRILTIWPNEDFLAPLECTLDIMTLLEGSRPVYDALSYYWGSVNDLEHVTVHGSDEGLPMPSCEVPVSKNLDFALRHLRKSAAVTGETLEIWTDAVCINQRDAEERSDQVAIMELLFQRSRLVCAWLSGARCSMSARKGFRHLTALCRRFGTAIYNKVQREELVAAFAKDLNSEAFELLDSVMAVLDLPYWRRDWILQEMCVVDVPICLSSQGQMFSLAKVDTLNDVIHGLCAFAVTQDLYVVSRLHNAKSTGEMLSTVLSLREVRLFVRVTPPQTLLTSRNLLDYTLMSKTWHTSDPRDCVFVLRSFHPALRGVIPNYSATVEEVYTSATVLLLRHTGTWSYLFWSQPSQSPYLPSWVVDFSSNAVHTGSPDWDVDRILLHHGKFDASANSNARHSVTRPSTVTPILHTAAFVYDKIVGISRCLPTSERENKLAFRAWTKWLPLIREHVVRDWISVFRMMCAGLALNDKRFTPDDCLLFWDHPLGEVRGIPKRPTSEAEEGALQKWKYWIT